jgi:hypothetical protein
MNKYAVHTHIQYASFFCVPMYGGNNEFILSIDPGIFFEFSFHAVVCRAWIG